jgi:hypothetical protein
MARLSKSALKDLHDVTTDTIAGALAQGHPKSAPVNVHRGMEGQRTGLPHLTPHSLRFREAHARMGTKLEPEKTML